MSLNAIGRCTVVGTPGYCVGNDLLQALVRAHAEFIANADPREIFHAHLTEILEFTESQYGFVAEFVAREGCQPRLDVIAIASRGADEATGEFFGKHMPQFPKPRSLIGAAIMSAEPLISNDPSEDPRCSGLPPGHPPLHAFLGLPFSAGAEPVGLVGLANRPGGYQPEMLTQLAPFRATCASIVMAWRSCESQRAAERAVRESEERLRAILAGAVDAIITIDTRGAMRSANPATVRMFGFTSEELIGRNVALLMPDPSARAHDGYIARYLASGERRAVGGGREVQARRKDGTLFPGHLTVSEVEFSGQRLFTAILRDVSELKASEELRLAQITRSREDLRAILNEMRLGTILLDERGRVTFHSAACAPLLVKDPDGQTRWEKVLALQADDQERLRRVEALPARERERVPMHIEVADGRHFWVEIEVHDDPRSEGGKMLFLYDVTQVHDLRQELDRKAEFGDLIGRSPPMRQLFRAITDLAKVDVTVLIEGETGTGKELVARALHARSRRDRGPFLAVNCAGLSDSLLNSQLFGHRRGAFTGAIADQAGVFEAAGGGTVFLDEIGDVSPDVQRALLRVLQEREITRLGDVQPRKVDVRIIAATHRDLRQQVDAGQFRLDLLYRIRIGLLSLPRLRERPTDIPLLVAAFLRKACTATGKTVERVSADAMDMLMCYRWPGNVRELQNAIEVGVVRCRRNVLECRDLPAEVQAAPAALPARSTKEVPTPGGAAAGGPDDERTRLEAALRSAGGNRAAAARALGISRATFYRRLKELGIGPDGPDSD